MLLLLLLWDVQVDNFVIVLLLLLFTTNAVGVADIVVIDINSATTTSSMNAH